jgi:putative lipoic acid-binding regulatory protein
VDHLPSAELLDQTHEFPGPYIFKAIGRPEGGFVARIVAAIREELENEIDPPYRVRETAAGRHVAVTVEPRVNSAWEVLAVYQRLGQVEGVMFVF